MSDELMDDVKQHSKDAMNRQLEPIENFKYPEANASRSLVRKLSEVMAAVGYLQKTGKSTAQGYNYATEADVAEMMRDELAKRQVFIFPSLVSCSRTRVERPGYPAKQPDGSMKDTVKVSYATDLVMRWTFCDGESGERMECDIPGCSETPGDKGVYVAMTGSEKYLLMKSFLIPTGDDPESDDNEPRGTKEDAQALVPHRIAEYERKAKEQLAKAQATPIAKTAPVVPAPTPLAPETDFNALVAEADASRIASEVFGGDAQEPEDVPEGFQQRVISGVSKIMGKDKKFYDVTFGNESVRYFINHDDDPTHGIFMAHKGELAVLKLSEKKGNYPPTIRGVLKIGSADLSRIEGL